MKSWKHDSKSSHWNILMLSDLHLGDQLPGEARRIVEERSLHMDRRFSSFLQHYTHHRQDHLPWRLIIAGDFLDFMHCHVDFSLDSTKHESNTRWHALPFNLRHSLKKLRQLLALHPQSFRALARFLEAGHQLVVVPGNHDAEFGWVEIQEAFRYHLVQISRKEGRSLTASMCRSQVLFVDDFYYEPNRVYVEHGHHYDHLCTTEPLHHPALPEQEREIVSPTHIMNRFQNACQGILSKLAPDYIDTWGKKEYLQFYASLPWSERWQLTRHVVSTTFYLVKVSMHRQWKTMREEPTSTHLARDGQLALSPHVPFERPIQYRIKPMYDHLLDTAQTLFLDKILLMILMALSMTLIFGMQQSPSFKAFLMSLLSTLFVGSYVLLERRQKPGTLSEEMRKAAQILSLHPSVPLVVFGHNHEFHHESLDHDSMYVNLGAWTLMGEEEESLHMPYLVMSQHGVRDVLLFKSWGDRDFEQTLQRVRGQKNVIAGFHTVGSRSSHTFPRH